MRMLWATALGRKGLSTSFIITVALSDGAEGAGEAPTSFAVPHETPAAIAALLTKARPLLIGEQIGDFPALLGRLGREHPDFHMSLAGLEVAAFRAQLASTGAGELAYWGSRSRRIQTDITIPFITDPDALDAWLGWTIRTGFRTYKIKVSGKLDADLALVRAVHGRLAREVEGFVIRLDGNQGCTLASCLRMIDRLRKLGIGIELFEQPLPKDDLAGLKALTARSPVPIILDETVFTDADCRRVAQERLGHGVNVKIAKSGIEQSRRIVATARRAGLKLMIGCMTETMVGLSAGIRLAAGTGAFDYVDLDSVHLMFGRRRRLGITMAGREYLLED
jgi:L-alanine-DL-glutamate epimerase-like enolase superfamily enzyme